MNQLRKNLLSCLLFLLLALLSFAYYEQSDNSPTYVELTTESNSSESNFCSNIDYDDNHICITQKNMEFTILEETLAFFEISSESLLPSYIVWQPPKTS